MERTLVIVKPDAVQRGLIGEVISRFERRGLKIVAMKMMRIDTPLASRHYGEHKGKPFYEGLIDYITSAPVVAMVLEGPNAIQAVRNTMGATNPVAAAAGTIRGDWSIEVSRNLVHGSDGADTAAREIALFFKEEEILSWERDTNSWIVA